MKLTEIRKFFMEYQGTNNERLHEDISRMSDPELETLMNKIAINVVERRILLRRIYADLCKWSVIEPVDKSELDDVPIRRIITDTVEGEQTQQFIDMISRRELEIDLLEPAEREEEIRRLEQLTEMIVNAGT